MGNSLDLLLINPPRRKNGSDCLFNFPLFWIGSFLHQNKFKVKILNLAKPDYLFDLNKILPKYNPRFVAISCKWWDTLFGSLFIAREIKRTNSHIKIILGGQTATYFKEDLIEDPSVDFVIVGESESPLKALLNREKLFNLVYKKNNRVIHAPLKNFSPEDYCLTRISNLLIDNQTTNRIFKYGAFVYMGSGCKFNCFFCSASKKAQRTIFNRQGITYRKPRSILHDINLFSEYTKTLIFDFEGFGKKGEQFIKKILQKIPPKRFNVLYYAWRYNPGIMGKLSQTFNKIYYDLDVQVFSESLRKIKHKKYICNLLSSAPLSNFFISSPAPLTTAAQP